MSLKNRNVRNVTQAPFVTSSTATHCARVKDMHDETIVYEEASKVTAVDGAVQLDGPDAVDISRTPEAAEETSDRLSSEAMKARGQRRLKDLPHQPSD